MPLSGFANRLHAALVILLLALALAAPAAAHSLPISSIDLEYREDRVEGRVIVHMRELAPELGIMPSGDAYDPAAFVAREDDIGRLLANRITIGSARPRWTGIAPAAQDTDAIRLDFVIPGAPPSELPLKVALFPQDEEHQTFVNLYEDDSLRQQWLLGADDGPVTYYAGSTGGVLAMIATFVPSGVHHILIGPDHILFLVGLLLAGGSLRRLALIVTAFTIGHSITLSLAALNIFALPAALVEPAIALSIVVVGMDNLLRGEGRDFRPLMALAFGLVHGFGFAYVLRDFGLPDANLAVALLSFNIGVEIGQIAIVLLVAAILAVIRRHSETAANRVVLGGSLAVIAAGAYWFVDRVFLRGGV